MAKVATSAQEAIELDLLLKNRDKVTIGSNNLITDAKAQAIVLANNGYTKPTPEKIKVSGKQAHSRNHSKDRFSWWCCWPVSGNLR